MKFAPHAQKRLKERNITKKQVHETILDPPIKLPAFDPLRKRVRRMVKGRMLNVIYKESRNNIIVITAFWDEEQKGRA